MPYIILLLEYMITWELGKCPELIESSVMVVVWNIKPLKCVDEVFRVNSIKFVIELTPHIFHPFASLRRYSQFIHYASKNKWKAWIFDAFAFWLHLHDLLITIFGIKCITHAEQSAVCIHTHWREYWRCSVNPITKVLWFVDDVIWCFHICGNFINGHIVGWFKSVL